MNIVAIAIIVIYAYLGYKLKRNPLAWAFVGLGVLLSVPLACSPFLLIKADSDSKLLFWSLVNIAAPIFSLLIATYLVYKKGLLFNKTTTP